MPLLHQINDMSPIPLLPVSLTFVLFPYQEFEAKQGHNEDLGKVIGQKYLNYFLEDKALWDPGDEIFTKFLK